MSMWDIAKDVGGFVADATLGPALGLAEAAGDVGAGIYDYATGDSKNGKEHLKEAAWGGAGTIPFVGPWISGMHLAKDIKDTAYPDADAEAETDWAGMGAKALTIAGLPFGLSAMAAGAALGGSAGALVTPKAQGGFVPTDLGAMAASISGYGSAPVCLPGKPEPGPYDHYAD